MDRDNNRIVLSGVLEDAPVPDHQVMGEMFYTCMLKVDRLSGVPDYLPLTVSERLLDEEVRPGAAISIDGQVRTYNRMVEGVGRLVVTVFVQHLTVGELNENHNQVELHGTICKQPIFRTTPFGREICDMMLAVNRSFGKSDYIPSITWGRTARHVSQLKVGCKLHIKGRLQSRQYEKQLPDGTTQTRQVYEISVFWLEDETVPAMDAIETEHQTVLDEAQ